MTYLDGADYFVRVIPFPVDCVGGMVTPNDDGTYSIYINANVDSNRQREAYRHEVKHIVNGDFYNGKTIEEIENIYGGERYDM